MWEWKSCPDWFYPAGRQFSTLPVTQGMTGWVNTHKVLMCCWASTHSHACSLWAKARGSNSTVVTCVLLCLQASFLASHHHARRWRVASTQTLCQGLQPQQWRLGFQWCPTLNKSISLIPYKCNDTIPGHFKSKHQYEQLREGKYTMAWILWQLQHKRQLVYSSRKSTLSHPQNSSIKETWSKETVFCN